MLDNITSIIDKDFFDKEVSEMKIDKQYLYHYILIELNDGIYIKIDNEQELNNIDKNNIKYKYYCEKIHYYNESNNLLFDEGYPLYIHDVGYFMIEGLYSISSIDKELLNKYINKYKLNYNHDKYDDIEFLRSNKSVNTF